MAEPLRNASDRHSLEEKKRRVGMAEAVDGDGRNAGAGAAPPERIVDRRVEDPFILADKARLVSVKNWMTVCQSSLTFLTDDLFFVGWKPF